MKKFTCILLVLVLSLSFVSVAFADGVSGNFKKGKISQVDLVNRTVVFTPKDSPDKMLMKVGESVNLENIKLNDEILATLEKEGSEETITNVTTLFIGLGLKQFLFILFVGFVGGLVSGFIGSGGAFLSLLRV